MPGRKARKGNPEPSKRRPKPLGVCNEHVPTPKGKMCSELRRDAETAAEMTVADTNYTYRVTDCNTNYIYFRPHRQRNMVPLDPERFSTNQDAMIKLIGFAGNMTLSNGFLQGQLNNT